ncbi:MAG: hypothetical protein H6849_01200 [Alphaproteobacteria bacterium]|nr:MAG: hypothetical protein H6849_01200 [Alphaproteobacteria bacterium]
MNAKKKHLKWSNAEKLLVWLSFHMKIPYKDISALLDRTLASVQKVIKRYRLREQKLEITQEVRQELLRLLQHPQTNLAWTVRSFTEYFPEILALSPWAVNPVHPDDTNLHIQRKIHERSIYDEWNDWSEVMTYLKHENVVVSPILPKRTATHSYLVQGQIMDKTQLFLCANRMRAEHGLSPLLVPGLTFTH